MFLNTKRSVFAFVGTSMASLALLLTLIGIQYDTSLPINYEGGSGYEVLLRAAPIWAGILLTLLGVRNLTLGGAVWRYRGAGCSDVCEAVFINLLALVLSGACLGIVIWEAIETNIFDRENLKNSHEFVRFVSLAFILAMEVLWAFIGTISACVPVRRQDPHDCIRNYNRS